MEVRGIDKPDDVHLDGSDLTRLVRKRPAGQKPVPFARHQPLFWHLQKSRPIVAMRDGDWSLVAVPDYELSTNNMFQEAWIPVIKNSKGLYDYLQGVQAYLAPPIFVVFSRTR